MNVFSSLDLRNYKKENTGVTYSFKSNKIKQVIFLIGNDKLNLMKFNLDEKLININIDLKDFKLESQKVVKILQFIDSIQ